MVRYKVEDMTCGGCVARITRALQQIDAQVRVDVDRSQRLVRIDSAATPEKLEGAIRNAGYTPVSA